MGKINLGADMLSLRNVPSDKWTLHSQTVQVIWGIYGRPEVDLFASEDNTHCQIDFSRDRYALAHDWPNLLLYAFPPPSEQDQGLNLICPVRALRIYIEHSAPFRQSEQLFVCFGGHTKGSPVTKQSPDG